MSEHATRMRVFVGRLKREKIDVAFLSDGDSIFYFSGVWGYLGMESGRATSCHLRKASRRRSLHLPWKPKWRGKCPDSTRFWRGQMAR